MSNEKEETFQEFVAECALRITRMPEEVRVYAYGKEPLEVIAEFTEIKPSDWHNGKVEKARERLAEIENCNDAQMETEAEAAYQEAKEGYESILAQQTKTRQHSENMLSLA